MRAVKEHDLLYILRTILRKPYLAQYVIKLEARDPRLRANEISRYAETAAWDSLSRRGLLLQNPQPGGPPSYLILFMPVSRFYDENAFRDNNLENAVKTTILRARLDEYQTRRWEQAFYDFKHTYDWTAAAALLLMSLARLQHLKLGVRADANEDNDWLSEDSHLDADQVRTSFNRNRWITQLFRQVVAFQDTTDPIGGLSDLKSVTLIPQHCECLNGMRIPFPVYTAVPYLRLRTVVSFAITSSSWPYFHIIHGLLQNMDTITGTLQIKHLHFGISCLSSNSL